jgi:hypothetical protein
MGYNGSIVILKENICNHFFLMGRLIAAVENGEHFVKNLLFTYAFKIVNIWLKK